MKAVSDVEYVDCQAEARGQKSGVNPTPRTLTSRTPFQAHDFMICMSYTVLAGPREDRLQQPLSDRQPLVAHGAWLTAFLIKTHRPTRCCLDQMAPCGTLPAPKRLCLEQNEVIQGATGLRHLVQQALGLVHQICINHQVVPLGLNATHRDKITLATRNGVPHQTQHRADHRAKNQS